MSTFLTGDYYRIKRHSHSSVEVTYPVINLPPVVFAYWTINTIHMVFDSFDALREYLSTFEILKLIHHFSLTALGKVRQGLVGEGRNRIPLTIRRS